MLLSWAMKERDGNIYCEVIRGPATDTEDKRLIKAWCDLVTARRYELIVVYWGRDQRFDLPFARTKAVTNNVAFPVGIKTLDIYDVMKSKFRLRDYTGGGLDDACREFNITTDAYPTFHIKKGEGKTHIEPRVWRQAFAGNARALSYIKKHNIIDVLQLEKLHIKLEPYIAGIGRRL